MQICKCLPKKVFWSFLFISHWLHWSALIFLVSVQIRVHPWLVLSPTEWRLSAGYILTTELHWTTLNQEYLFALRSAQKSQLSKPSVSVLVGIVEISASLRARSINFCVSVLIRAHPWEIEALLYFLLKNRIFQTFLTKNLHFAWDRYEEKEKKCDFVRKSIKKTKISKICNDFLIRLGYRFFWIGICRQ